MLSVLMPVKHYHGEFLHKAVQCIMRQTSPHWELLILVEPENTEHFANELQSELQDTRIRLVTGRRLAGALNAGMRAGTSEFVAILLADDLWSDDAVAVLLKAITDHPHVDFFHSARRYIDAQDRFCSSIYPPIADFTTNDFSRGSPVKHLLCWRRETGLAIGGIDETLESVGPDDYDFPWCMAEHGAVFHGLPECLYYYRDHRESFRLSTHLPLTVHTRGITRIMRKHGVPRHVIRRQLRIARASYLRQCLFRSPLHRWIKELWGYDPHRGGRETYS